MAITATPPTTPPTMGPMFKLLCTRSGLELLPPLSPLLAESPVVLTEMVTLGTLMRTREI